jgi:hypothetical protein
VSGQAPVSNLTMRARHRWQRSRPAGAKNRGKSWDRFDVTPLSSSEFGHLLIA